jgi:type II secretory pathway pseudopilin PulG
MKTNADLSHSELKNTCERERAFTLTDLLVVLATLAILAALILPALARSGDNGMRTVCLNNLRQLGMALNMYTGENQDYLPWPNWGTPGDSDPAYPPGWLYGKDPNNPNDLFHATVSDWTTLRVDDLATGTYWQYLHSADVFICPVFGSIVVGTGPRSPFNWQSYRNKLSTYCMNGASCFFPGTDGTSANLFHYRTAKASQVWSPLCIIQWEPSGVSGVGGGYNDGANYPDPTEGVSGLHVTGAPVLTVGGSSRFMSFADFTAEMNHPLKDDCSHGRGLLWWSPNRCDGHGLGE